MRYVKRKRKLLKSNAREKQQEKKNQWKRTVNEKCREKLNFMPLTVPCKHNVSKAFHLGIFLDPAWLLSSFLADLLEDLQQ